MEARDCIFFQMTKAGKAGAMFALRKVEHLGVTISQAMVLNFLGEDDCISPHILSKKLQITSATLTGILDRLEKMDLIERRAHPDDRRAILVCLAGKGIRHAKKINAIMVQANEEFLSQLSPEECQTFRSLLNRLSGGNVN